MKNLILATLCTFIFTLSGYGKIINVDNTPGAEAEYSDIATAINIAASGDTIRIHPSGFAYSNITVSKKLTFFGSGHGSPSGSQGATIGIIYLRTGASGSVFNGLRINYIKTETWQVVHNITIENNYFYGSWTLIEGASGDGSDSDNWLIKGNVMEQVPGCGGCTIVNVNTASFDNSNDNWTITNNIVFSASTSGAILSNLNGTTLVNNNTFIFRNTSPVGEVFDTWPGRSSSNATLTNNIFVLNSTDGIMGACTNCTFSNNLTYSTGSTMGVLPGNDNLDNVNPLFEDVPEFKWDYSYNFRLAENSPAKLAGTDEAEIGAYGGIYRFNRFGLPLGFPVIEAFFLDKHVINRGNNINIRLKAKVIE